jgi:hypothetical protein
MFQAITTKFLGPTNHRGARIKARAHVGSVTVGWDYSLSSCENHTAAALALAEKWGWEGEWLGGTTYTNEGYTFVRTELWGMNSHPLHFQVEAK